MFAASPAANKPTLYIVGDSTVHNGTRGQQGWGEPIAGWFDLERIRVENHAMGGRSSRTFQTEGRWDAILKTAKAGDFVLVQMGHNDAGKVNDDSRARGTLPGVGEETQEIDNLLTKKHETVHTYGWYLRKYITDAKSKGMTPIICSPIPHAPNHKVAAGEVENNRFAGWAEQVAESEHVPFIHLNKIVMGHYAGMSPEEIKVKYFTSADNTHTSPAGAELNAQCVAEGLRGLKDCPLVSYLRKEVFPRGVHDPAMAKENGTYYVFSTGNGIDIRQSSDLVHWRKTGQVFASTPAWVRSEIPGARNIWAPDISFFDGEYHLYYAVSTFGSRRSCIGLATNKTLDPASPAYHWSDRGKVLESGEKDDWNAIDPSIVMDGKTPWLCCGSFWSGIKLCELDPQTGKPQNHQIISLATRPQAKAIEAPFIVRYGSFFYLFVSFDYCCRGVNSDYKIMVGRADHVAGPYTDRQGRAMLQGGGTLVLQGEGRMRGPGGQSLLADGNKWWLVYHFYDADSRGMPCLQIRPLNWENDWPVAGDPLPGVTQPDLGVPAREPTPASRQAVQAR